MIIKSVTILILKRTFLDLICFTYTQTHTTKSNNLDDEEEINTNVHRKPNCPLLTVKSNGPKANTNHPLISTDYTKLISNF